MVAFHQRPPEQQLWRAGGGTCVLTDELDRLVEPRADIGFVVVLDGDALVEEGVLKVVGTVGRHIDKGGDPQHLQHVFSGGMVSAAKVQEWEDLHGTPLNRNENKPFSHF